MDTLYTLMPLILLIFIMYFLLIRPQKKKERQVNAMRSSIKVGDSIITIGGIYGTVSRVKDDSLVIQVGADKVKLEVTRWAISKVVEDGGAPASKTSKSKPVTEAKEDIEPEKKAPRRRLEKTSKPVPDDEPFEQNPLEADSEKSPLDKE